MTLSFNKLEINMIWAVLPAQMSLCLWLNMIWGASDTGHEFKSQVKLNRNQVLCEWDMTWGFTDYFD